MSIYLIGGSDAVKIGVTSDPGRAGALSRLKALQTGSPHPLHLIGTVPGARNTEQAIHRQFAAFRLTGEWFRREGPVKEFADNLRAFPCSLMGLNDPILGICHKVDRRTLYRVFVCAGGVQWWRFEFGAEPTKQDPIEWQARAQGPAPSFRGVLRDAASYEVERDSAAVSKLVAYTRGLGGGT